MNWVEDEYRQRGGEQPPGPRAVAGNEKRVEEAEQNKWTQLLRGLEQDVQDYKRIGGEASFEQKSEVQCRVSSGKSLIAVVVTEDPEARTIRYEYAPLRETMAVPEGGILTVRESGTSTDLYSADQRLSAEGVRKLILEPLLFPRAALEGLEPTGT
jgi:hypothetical protein